MFLSEEVSRMLQLVVFIRKKRSNYGLGSIKLTFLYRRAYRTTSIQESIYNYVKNMRRVFVMPLFFFNFAEF